MKKFFLIIILFTLLTPGLKSAPADSVSVNFVKKENEMLPGEIVNLTLFITNNTSRPIQIKPQLVLPEGWNNITKSLPLILQPAKKNFSIYTIQIPSNCPVGTYEAELRLFKPETQNLLTSAVTKIKVKEIEKITFQLVESPDHVIAGEDLTASYLIQNLGNTEKKIFIEAQNCDIKGSSEIQLQPDESSKITILKQTSPEIVETRKDYYSVRAYVADRLIKSIYNSVIVFPAKNVKKDPFFRFPVSASVSYLATNRSGTYEQAYQYEIAGSGTLDTNGKNRVEFMARGPNNTGLSFLGMYSQHYISYANKNLELFAGEQSYRFTPLTESSRFGLGAESKVILNNGLSVGFLFLKPRYYESIKNEFSAYTNFDFNKDNSVGLHFIQKKTIQNDALINMASFTTKLQPFNKTNIEMEFSGGKNGDVWDKAFMTNINTQFSIFQLAGNYFYTGKNYPGYYNNSTFYSGNLSAQLTQKISIGVYARQDFMNAELDTFFVTAPYSKSIRTILNYNIASRTFLNIYWREYERKDRLSFDKFHYKTKSFNSQLTQRFRKFEYILQGELGKTTNLLLPAGQNQQNTYRGAANVLYRLNSTNSFRLFGSWSNMNSFVSGVQRNLTAGLGISSQLWKKFRANFHIQNAYDIDDYYRNRNLMQLDLHYQFLKQHTFSIRSFYTIFKQKTDNPEFNILATYTYQFGVPVKRLIKSGELRGRATDNNGEPYAGLILHLQNKSTITDNNGEFWFKSIQPGRHLLTVDRSKFNIDEITNIPSPIEIEIIENQSSSLNFSIIKGAKIQGTIQVKKDNNPLFDNQAVRAQNIVIELKDEFEQYRLTPDENGTFSFPIIRPGQWTFRIFESSIPAGYVIEKTLYNLDLKPGEQKNINIELSPRKRNIIFKSQSTPLTTLKPGNNVPIKVSAIPNVKKQNTEDNIFYSIQVGAFRHEVKPSSRFFHGEKVEMERQIGNLYKYFIGKFKTLDEAKREKKRLDTIFNGTFIVVFKNNTILYNIH